MDTQHVLVLLGYGVLIAAFLVFVIGRQIGERTVPVKRLIVMPAAFAVLALVLDHELGHRLSSPPALAAFAVGIALGVLLGFIRAGTMTVRRTGDALVTRGDRRTLLWWIISIAVRIGGIVLLARFGIHEGTGEGLLFAAATIGAQNLAVARRAGLLSATPEVL